ncbi:MAG: lipoyl(octanoyl) transferase LipB [Deltaproteobacteria bacterium]|nr:lipoyl(octanoyl) transferase LipB [Deltaproteobacteria bacterium]
MIEVIRKGEIPYPEADSWQRELAIQRAEEKISDTLLLLEHPRTVTLGRRECSKDLKVSEESLRSLGIPVIKTDRGGGATYHGPGQLVGYFIFKLGQKPIPVFVREIEELLIRLLRQFDLFAKRDPRYPGVWIGQGKIAALGFHLERGVTRHGFALNVNPNLDDFKLITPCGIRDREVTSIHRELGVAPEMGEVRERLIEVLKIVGPSRRLP